MEFARKRQIFGNQQVYMNNRITFENKRKDELQKL